MKRLTILLTIIILTGSLNAQFIRKWERSSALGNIPAWFSTNSSTGGICFSVQSNAARLYVISNKINPQVVILNPYTGDSIGTLNTTGISGGIYALNDLAAYNRYAWNDHRIYACNLTDNASLSPFKIYVWENELSVPQVFLVDSVSTFRLGDNLNAFRMEWGLPEYHLTTASSGNNKIVDFISSDGIAYTRNSITLSDGILGANASADYNWVLGYYVNSDNRQPKRYFSDGSLQSITPASIISPYNNSLKYYDDGNLGYANPFFVTYNYISNNAELVQFFHIPPYWSATPSLGTNPDNSNFGDVDLFWGINDSLFVVVLSGNNGLGVYYAQGFFFPVELTSFTAGNTDEGVLLEWITATELNNRGFDLEKSFDEGISWKTIGFIKGKGTSTDENFYSFLDDEVYYGGMRYRLKQIDFDGTYCYSEIVEVISGLPAHYSLSQNYPNPFNPYTIIKYSLPAGVNSRVKLTIHDILGNEIAVLVNEEKPAGEYKVEWNASAYSSRVYFYRLTAGQFTSTKKLLLIK